jgi:hypothetical protein
MKWPPNPAALAREQPVQFVSMAAAPVAAPGQ